jgi:hypothetical protein
MCTIQVIMQGIMPDKFQESKTHAAGFRIHCLESFDIGPFDH